MGRERRVVCQRDIVYRALPSQRRFHQLTTRFKGFSGPIGSGKSQALCQELIRAAYLNPGRTGLLGAPTYAMLRDATLTTLTEVLDASRLPYEVLKSEGVLLFKDTQSRVLLRSLDEYERLRGTNLAWFAVDELTYAVEEAWLRLEGRLRDPKAGRLTGFAVWTPKGHDWVWRRFIEATPDGYGVVQAKPYENRHLLEQVPDFYERLKGSYDAKFYAQEVLGEYLGGDGGLVYSAFRWEDHVNHVAATPNEPLLWALDFNVDPMCSVVAQRQGDHLTVLDEIVLEHATTHEACEEFYRRFPTHPAGLVIFGDAAGNQRQTSGTTDYQMVRQFFQRVGYPRVSYRVANSNPLVRERVGLMNATLRNAAGEKHMTISRRCNELVKDMEQVRYKPGTGIVDKHTDPKRTHLSDALGYLVWQEFRPATPTGEKGRRLL